MEVLEEDLEPSAADNLKSLVQECGVSPHKISELLQELPPQRVSDVLINYYFTSMCVTFDTKNENSNLLYQQLDSLSRLREGLPHRLRLNLCSWA